MSKNDIDIARKVISEGRALVIVLNKWDQIPRIERMSVLKGFHELLNVVLPQCKGYDHILTFAVACS